MQSNDVYINKSADGTLKLVMPDGDEFVVPKGFDTTGYTIKGVDQVAQKALADKPAEAESTTTPEVHEAALPMFGCGMGGLDQLSGFASTLVSGMKSGVSYVQQSNYQLAIESYENQIENLPADLHDRLSELSAMHKYLLSIQKELLSNADLLKRCQTLSARAQALISETSEQIKSVQEKKQS